MRLNVRELLSAVVAAALLASAVWTPAQAAPEDAAARAEKKAAAEAVKAAAAKAAAEKAKAVADAAKLDAAMKQQAGANQEAIASQERIDKLDDEASTMLQEYRNALNEAESFDTYAAQLQVQIASQTAEMARIEFEMSEAEVVSRDVTPMMTRMIDNLEQFVQLDVPFLLEERTKRAAGLREVMTRADVSVSERYRRILEAYQIEMEFGRTIEHYEGTLGEGNDQRTLQFLRIGRVALLYQTDDQRETGYWDADRKQWVVDDHYRDAFQAGVGVATKRTAPDLVLVPTRAPKEKQL
jgi:hypothetical protein